MLRLPGGQQGEEVKIALWGDLYAEWQSKNRHLSVITFPHSLLPPLPPRQFDLFSQPLLSLSLRHGYKLDFKTFTPHHPLARLP